MILGFLLSATVLSAILYLVAGESSLPGFRELAFKVLITSLITGFAGFFLNPVNIILSIAVRFILMVVALSILLQLEFKQTAIVCGIHQGFFVLFSLKLRSIGG